VTRATVIDMPVVHPSPRRKGRRFPERALWAAKPLVQFLDLGGTRGLRDAEAAPSFLAVAATGATINFFAWDQLCFHLARAFGPSLHAGRPRLAARIDRFRGPLDLAQLACPRSGG